MGKAATKLETAPQNANQFNRLLHGNVAKLN